MKYPLVVVLFFLAGQVALLGETNLVLTVDGVAYSNVTFGLSSPNQVIMFHSRGITGVRLDKLPAELQRRFQYDPQKAAEHRKKLEDADNDRVARNMREALDAAEKDRSTRNKQEKMDERAPLFTIKGAGTEKTEPFTVSSPWKIVWIGLRRADKRTERLSGRAVTIGIYTANGEVVGVTGNESGEGSSYQPKGGTYHLRITGEGLWQVSVIPITE